MATLSKTKGAVCGPSAPALFTYDIVIEYVPLENCSGTQHFTPDGSLIGPADAIAVVDPLRYTLHAAMLYDVEIGAAVA